MSNKLNVGVMGCANFAERSAIPTILELNDQFELATVASRTDEKANAFAEKFSCRATVGYDSLVEDSEVDLIYMPLPTDMHDEWVVKCLDAGKHVVVEKSMSSSLSAAEAMCRSAEKNNRLLAENFMFQYHQQMAVMSHLIDDGTIGRVRQLRSSFGFPPLPSDNFRFKKELGGGSLLDAGAYTLKAAQFFLGRDLDVLSASLVDTMGVGVDTSGAAHLVSNEGISALVGFGFENFYQCNIEIWGTEGKVSATRAFTAKPDFSPEIIVEKQGQHDIHKIDPDHQFRNFLLEIHGSIMNQDWTDFRKEAMSQAKLIADVFEAAR